MSRPRAEYGWYVQPALASVEVPRRPRVGLLQGAISLAALAGIVWWATRQKAPHVPLDPPALGRLGAALGIYAIATLMRAERWHRILAHAGLDRGRAESYRLTAVGYMGNNTLPARAGDLMRVVLLGGPRRAVLGTVVAERLLDVCALAVIFAFVLVARGGSFGPLPYLAGAGALAVGAVVALRQFAPRVRAWVTPIMGATHSLASAHGAVLLVLSIVLWLAEASVYYVVGAAVGIDLSASGALYVMALTNLSSMIPAAPGYVGTFDAAVLLALRSLNRPALGYLLVLRFVLFVPITVVGFAIFVSRGARKRREGRT